MAQSKLLHRYRHVAAVIQITDDINEVVLFGGCSGGEMTPISRTSLIRLERNRSHLTTSASAGKWMIANVADLHNLAANERKQRRHYKKELYDKENEKAYKKAVEEELSVPIHVARLNFVGLPRSGKTTTMKRLIGEILKILNEDGVDVHADGKEVHADGKEEKSTGIVERNQIIIKNISKSFSFTSSRKWSSRKDLTGEIGVFNQLIHEIVKESERWKKEIIDMNLLNLIEYMDSKTGKKIKLKILQKLSPKWEEIGKLLGLESPEIEEILSLFPGKTTADQCIQEVFSRWLQNPHSQKYQNNWRGVYKILVDFEHRDAATKLMAAIRAPESSFHGFDEDVSSVQLGPQKPLQAKEPSVSATVKEVKNNTANEEVVSKSQNQDSSPHEIDTHGDFNNLLSSYNEEDSDTVRYHLEDTIYLINTDTGGQTEFLDLMSPFLLGPALNLIISRLIDPLDQVYKVYFTDEDGHKSKEEYSVVTLEEVIFQALASISSLEASYDHSVSMGENSDKKMVCSSKAMLVGTFGDKMTPETFKIRDENLMKKIMETDFYHNELVLFASGNNLIYSLDNAKGDPDEIDAFRKSIEKIIKEKFQQVDFPVSWLILSVNIRHTGKPFMTLHECEEMATKLKITKDNLKKALWFLHHHVGILLYYSEEEISGFGDLIICKVQVVFDTATQLVKKTFIYDFVGKKVENTFKEKAQFKEADLHQAISKYADQAASKSAGDDLIPMENLIPMEKLVVLLEHHKILAQLPQCKDKTYFMPCVLKSATPEERQNVRGSEDVAPLFIRYVCGYVPLGIFSSLVISLVSENKWTLIEDGPRRNMIQYHVGIDYDTVTLISCPTYLKIMLLRSTDPKICTPSICYYIRTTITKALEMVHKDQKYHSTATFQYGLMCPSHPEEDHLCVWEQDDTFLCLKNLKRKEKIALKKREHRVWFYMDRPKELFDSSDVWSKKASLMLLQLIKYTDSGEKKELRIIKLLSGKWDEIAISCGLESEIDIIRNSGSGKNPEQCMLDVIEKWKRNPPPNYPFNWKGVHDLLKDLQYSTAANDLEVAIAASDSSFHSCAHGTSKYSSAAPVSEDSLAQEQSSQLQELLQLQEPIQQPIKERGKLDENNRVEEREGKAANPTKLTLHPVYSILMILLLLGFGALMLYIVSGIITFNNTKNPAATLELSLDDTPQFSDFLSFPRSSDSKKKNIVEVVARDCEDLGHHLGLELFEVENIQADSVHRTLVDKCREIIKKWLQKSKPKSPITWRTFLKGLEDVKYWELRDFMYKILTQSSSDEGKEL